MNPDDVPTEEILTAASSGNIYYIIGIIIAAICTIWYTFFSKNTNNMSKTQAADRKVHIDNVEKSVKDLAILKDKSDELIDIVKNNDESVSHITSNINDIMDHVIESIDKNKKTPQSLDIDMTSSRIKSALDKLKKRNTDKG